MLETFDSFGGHHFLEKERVDPSNALTVMEDAGALFDVWYPASGYNDHGNYEVPVVGRGKNEGVPLHKYVIREDTGDVLGLHSHSYAENPSGYMFLGKIAEMMFPSTTTSCTLFGVGEKVALTQDIVAPLDLGNNDWIQPQICWISSFNGTWKTSAYSLTHRLFCQNQLIGEVPLIGVKHTRNHDQLLEMRVAVLAQAVERAETLKRMALTLKDQEFTDAAFNGLTAQLLPAPDPDAHGKTVASYERKLFSCWERWRKERAEFGPGNRWMAFNAVQGAEQHDINGAVRGRRNRDRALEKAIENKTPLTDKALALLTV